MARTMNQWRAGLATLGMAMALAGCADIAADIDLVDQAFARARVTYVTDEATASTLMDAVGPGEVAPVCDNPGNAVVTCVDTREGSFASLSEDGFVIETLSSGDVRVSFETAMLTGQAGVEEAGQAEALAMMAEMFTGRHLTVSIGPGRVMETNMNLSADASRAVLDLPLDQAIAGTFDLPDQYFAIIRR